MRLKKIKLSGFKSFVDPTTIEFPSQLVGVVGPNGCGKSNVIDAVRWVMGESSARQLRGDSMDDVIFNGSSARKPVGQASVELIFDNSDGGLGGQYAGYNEVSVRRLLARDGQSTYSLNGSRCRRRDITDIFLGTGLGPRSYAIIEQGTISRLVEARPEELRVFLEEAAGISRYKERRRETELRIRDTNENLERVNDVIGELERRLQTLQRQARSAERYKLVKQDERQCKAELLALRWAYLDNLLTSKQKEVVAQENQLEAHIAALRSIESETEQQHQLQIEANEALNGVQAEFYSAGGEVARLEQSIQHHNELLQRYRRELDEVDRQRRDMSSGLDDDDEKIAALQDIISSLTPELEQTVAREGLCREHLEKAETVQSEWRIKWDRLQQELAGKRRDAEVDHTRIQHDVETRLRLSDRLSGLASELRTLGEQVAKDDDELRRMRADLVALVEEKATAQKSLSDIEERLGSLRDQNGTLEQERDRIRDQLQPLHQEQASLTALQNAALGKQGTILNEWLGSHGLDGQQRLAELIQVEAGWERAAERVLGSHLQALAVDDLEGFTAAISQLNRGHLTLIEPDGMEPGQASEPFPPLLDKIDAPSLSLAALLNGISVCEELADALAIRDSLPPGHSVVTRHGHWLGRNWLSIDRGAEESGVLSREQRLRDITAECDELERKLQDLVQVCTENRQQMNDLEATRQTSQLELRGLEARHAEAASDLARREATLDQSRQRQGGLGEESAALEDRLQTLDTGLTDAREALAEKQRLVAALEASSAELSRQGEAFAGTIRESRESLAAAQRDLSNIRTRIETSRASHEALVSGRKRILAQREEIDRRHAALIVSISEADAPLKGLNEALKTRISGRMDIENRLQEARSLVTAGDHRLRELADAHRAAEQRLNAVRADLERMRLSLQEEHVRRETLQEQLSGMSLLVKDVLASLPEGANEAEWQARLDSLERKIQRMGPINLAAIDECQEQEERKQYLDAQATDLHHAMETLQRAIQKIDNETKQRFRETFDQVNERLASLYPRLFGGGKAHLEMIGDDLLDAGVAVVARPPGKRNSSIHQLSGGEKALTAVALVFAFFELNPSPFCMLDEVDAPLDDNNAARFCRMVEEMSEKTQFIFISHNKIAMEMGQQLLGVTMHEPGVSRLVSVDIEAATEMAATG